MPATPVLPADPGQLLSVTAVPGDPPGCVRVEVRGQVDTATAPLLQLCLDSQTSRPDVHQLVVDLDQVTSLGAAGVAALARAQRRCARRGVRLLVQCAGRRRVLDPRLLRGLADGRGSDPVRPDLHRQATGRQATGRTTVGRTATRPRPAPRHRRLLPER